MTDQELKTALKSYTQPGAEQLEPVRNGVLEQLAQEAPAHTRRHPRHFGLAAAAVLLLIVFLQTPPGAAAAGIVREQVVQLIELLFPSKDITVTLEGMLEEIPHTAQGQEPETADDKPGFALYVDSERYAMTEENGVTYVRPYAYHPTREDIWENNRILLKSLSPEEAEAEVDRRLAEQEAFYASLPPCEIEVVHLPDTAPESAAKTAHSQMLETWAAVSEISESSRPAGLYFTASQGNQWNLPQEERYFVEDGLQGTFQLTIRCFLEASEGHGTRMRTMTETFSVIQP